MPSRPAGRPLNSPGLSQGFGRSQAPRWRLVSQKEPRPAWREAEGSTWVLALIRRGRSGTWMGAKMGKLSQTRDGGPDRDSPAALE